MSVSEIIFCVALIGMLIGVVVAFVIPNKMTANNERIPMKTQIGLTILLISFFTGLIGMVLKNSEWALIFKVLFG